MDYQLLPHEFMIMHSDHVCSGNSTTLTDELILTNLNLVHIKKGIFGGKKSQQLIPINQIKLFEGIALKEDRSLMELMPASRMVPKKRSK